MIIIIIITVIIFNILFKQPKKKSFRLQEWNIEYDNNNNNYYYHNDDDKSNILPRKRNVVNSPVFEHEYAIHQIVNKF